MINVFGYFSRTITNSLHINEYITFLLGHNKVPYLFNATHIDWSVYTDQGERKTTVHNNMPWGKKQFQIYFGSVNYELFGTVNYYTKWTCSFKW